MKDKYRPLYTVSTPEMCGLFKMKSLPLQSTSFFYKFHAMNFNLSALKKEYVSGFYII